jgi:hypothetical protein
LRQQSRRLRRIETSADDGAMTMGVEIVTADSPDSIEDVGLETEAANGEDAQWHYVSKEAGEVLGNLFDFVD